MAAQTTFVSALTNQWTPICEYRDGRQSLIVQCADQAIVLGFRTSGPMLSTPLGNFPAGLFSDVDNGIGPWLYRFSRAIDGDLVKQAWFAWISGVPVPPVVGSQGLFQLGFNPTTAFVPANAGDFVSIWAFTADTVPVAPTLVSTVMGPLPPVNAWTVPGDAGDSGILSLWAWVSPSTTTDLVTLSTGNTANLTGQWQLTGGTGLDVSGQATAAGAASIMATTSGPVLAAGETLIAATVTTDAGQPNVWPPSWGGGLSNSGFVSPDGTLWFTETSFSSAGASAPQAVTVSFPGPATNALCVIQAVLPVTPLSSAAVVTVIEAFDNPPPSPPPMKRFTVPLPKLSPGGMLALKDLLKKVQ